MHNMVHDASYTKMDAAYSAKLLFLTNVQAHAINGPCLGFPSMSRSFWCCLGSGIQRAVREFSA